MAAKREKSSDTFWRESMMKLLTCLHHEELTWAKDFWQEYGISARDKKRIEKRWQRHVEPKSKRSRQIKIETQTLF